MTEDTLYNTYRARVGDVISVTRDGRTSQMVVWRIDAPGTAGTSYAAGPHVAAWIRPGGYGVTLDAGNVEQYSARLIIPAAAADTPEG
jgi:hypothetical protein